MRFLNDNEVTVYPNTDCEVHLLQLVKTEQGITMTLTNRTGYSYVASEDVFHLVYDQNNAELFYAALGQALGKDKA